MSVRGISGFFSLRRHGLCCVNQDVCSQGCEDSKPCNGLKVQNLSCWDTQQELHETNGERLAPMIAMALRKRISKHAVAIVKVEGAVNGDVYMRLIRVKAVVCPYFSPFSAKSFKHRNAKYDTQNGTGYQACRRREYVLRGCIDFGGHRSGTCSTSALEER